MFIAKNGELTKAIDELESEDRNAVAAMLTPESAMRAINSLPRLFAEASTDRRRCFLDLMFDRSPFVDGGIWPRFKTAFKPFDTRPADPYE